MKQENENARVDPQSGVRNPEIQKESGKKLFEAQNPNKKGQSFQKKQKMEVESERKNRAHHPEGLSGKVPMAIHHPRKSV